MPGSAKAHDKSSLHSIKKTKSCPHCDGAERAAFLFFIYVSAVGRSAGQKASEGMFSFAQTLVPILPRLRFGKRSPKAAARRGETLSVTASPCHLSRKGEALAEAKSFALTSWLLLAVDWWGRNLPFLPRARPSGELSSAARLRGFVRKKPSPSRLRRATSPERERLWQGRKVLRLQVGFF